MFKNSNAIKILLCEGITDGFARASNAVEALNTVNKDYTFAYTPEYLKRNRIGRKTLSEGLGLSKKGVAELNNNWEETHKILSIGQCEKIDTILKRNPKAQIIIDTNNTARFWHESNAILGKSGKKTYQRYCSDFKNIILSGQILKEATKPPRENKLFIHYRLGDIALLSCKDLAKIFKVEPEAYSLWLCPLQSELLSFDNIIDMAPTTGKEGTKIILERFIPNRIYEKFLTEISPKFQSIHFSNDGFTRSAIAAKRIFGINETIKNIENKLERLFLSKIKKIATTYSIGEDPHAMDVTLRECARSSHWQMGGSWFPFDLFQKCGIERTFCSPPLRDHPSRIRKIFKNKL